MTGFQLTNNAGGTDQGSEFQSVAPPRHFSAASPITNLRAFVSVGFSTTERTDFADAASRSQRLPDLQHEEEVSQPEDALFFVEAETSCSRKETELFE